MSLQNKPKIQGLPGHVQVRALVGELFGIQGVWANMEPWPTNIHRYNDWSRYFSSIITAQKPKIIVEIGSWYGFSAISMANILKKEQLDSMIICIDTWLGSIEHWAGNVNREQLMLKNGYPQVFYQFMSNVKNAGHLDTIFPIPMPSLAALRWMDLKGVKADMVYIDGSHNEHDVNWDLRYSFSILNDGGTLCGDDYTWNTVSRPVEAFAAEIGKKVVVGDQIISSRGTPQAFWMIKT